MLNVQESYCFPWLSELYSEPYCLQMLPVRTCFFYLFIYLSLDRKASQSDVNASWQWFLLPLLIFCHFHMLTQSSLCAKHSCSYPSAKGCILLFITYTCFYFPHVQFLPSKFLGWGMVASTNCVGVFEENRKLMTYFGELVILIEN